MVTVRIKLNEEEITEVNALKSKTFVFFLEIMKKHLGSILNSVLVDLGDYKVFGCPIVYE